MPVVVLEPKQNRSIQEAALSYGWVVEYTEVDLGEDGGTGAVSQVGCSAELRPQRPAERCGSPWSWSCLWSYP